MGDGHSGQHERGPDAESGLGVIESADRRRLLETQEIAGVGSWDWFVQANVVVWTPELYRIHGIDPDDFDGTYEAFLDLVYHEDRRHTEQVIAKAYETREPFVYEHRIVLPDGRVRSVESRGRCDVDEDGSLVKMTGTCQDVTHRLRSQEELREAHERYRSLVEAIPAISYIDSLRPRVKTIFVSPQIADIVGYGPDEVAHGFWADRLHPDDRDEVVALRRRAYAVGEDFSCEYRIVAADGRTVWMNDQAVIVRDEDSNPVFAQGIMYDVSDRKRLEDQLVQSQKMDALGRLAGGIAHDFNNLLTAILGNTELLLDGEQDQNDILASAVEIHEAALLGAELVRQLLGFTRMKPGVARTLDVRRVALSAEGLLSRVIGEDVTLVIKVSEETLPVRIDESQLAQVVMNLVLNAREAMPEGGSITLEVFPLQDASEVQNAYTVGLESDATGPFAALRVTDSGPGIEEDLQPLVFEPFFTTKTRGSKRGTGLGLANVYAVVTRAGGSVSVASSPGLGASITVLLPLQALTEDTVVVLDRPHKEAAGERVLVVEDDERVRNIATSLLQRSGYQAIAAGDGQAALRLAKQQVFDVLLVDVVMPGMDGKTVAARILEEQPNVGVLFMSGYSEQLAPGDLDVPGVDYIQKPFTREELDIKLQHVLSVERKS